MASLIEFDRDALIDWGAVAIVHRSLAVAIDSSGPALPGTRRLRSAIGSESRMLDGAEHALSATQYFGARSPFAIW